MTKEHLGSVLRPLRIFHVVDYLMQTMGYQEFLLPKWNARHGHEVHILTSDRYAPVRNYETSWQPLLGPRLCGAGKGRHEGVVIHRLRCLWEGRSRPVLRGLEKELGRGMPDVVFCHGSASFNAFRTARWCRLARVPLFMDNHMTYGSMNRSFLGDLYYGLLRSLTRRLLVPAVSRFLGVQQECCDFLLTEQAVPKERIGSLPFGVDADLFAFRPESRRLVRNQLQIPADAAVVLQTGKLTKDKAPQLLARAASPVMASTNTWLMYVGGGDPNLVREIQSISRTQGVEDRLRILPFVHASRLAEYYSAADICAYPGGTSLSAFEAAACARAVVMTDLPACRWREEHGVGLCCRNGDVRDLERTLRRLVADSHYRIGRGEAARQAVLSYFSYDSVAHRTEALMHEAVSLARAANRREPWPPLVTV